MATKKITVKRKRRVGGVPAAKLTRQKIGSTPEKRCKKILKEIDRLEAVRKAATKKEERLLYAALINKQHDRLDGLISGVVKGK